MPQIRIITSKSGDPSHVGVSGLVRSSGNQNTPNIVKILQASGVGPQGAAGPEGGTGPQGVQGETGPQGIQGLQGIQGPTGATGPQGDVGVTGPQGDAGITGETGNTGDVGITGPQGNTGDTGNQGPRGSTGPGATVGSAEYTYTSGALTGNATSNGEFLHNTSGNQSVSIFKFDNSGADNRDILAAAASSGSSGRVEIKFGNSITPRIFAFNIVTYDGTKFNFTPTRILPGSSAGSGKKIFVSVYVDNSVSRTARSFASDFFEFSDGTTAGTVVTSWNGETGDVVFDDYVSSVNGQTGAVTIEPGGVTSFNGLTGAVVGVSSVNGLTGAVTVSGGGGTTLAAGAGVTLSSIVAGVGYTLGIDPTAVVHVAGVSSDGGITLGGEIRSSNGKFYNTAADSGIDVSNISQTNIRVGGSARLSLSSSVVSTPVRFIGENVIEARGIIEAEAGISMDAAGITFPDGTFQSSAASGIAGATGATGNTGNDGPRGNTGATGAVDLSFTGGVPAGASAGDLWFDSDAGVFSVYIDDGDSQQWVELAGKQGPTGATGQDGSGGGGGGTTLAAGAGMTLSAISAGVGHTLGIDPTAAIHVAGVSCDGGITAGLFTINQIENQLIVPPSARIKNSNSHGLKFSSSGTQIQAAGSANNSFEVQSGLAIVNSSLLFHVKGPGISMDAGGITFPDGTFQSSAASGSGGGVSAGSGLTLAGSTLGIDPTAHIHVAGVSSDGGATFGGSVIIPNGQYIYNNQSSSDRPSIRLATSEITIDSKSSGTPGRIIVSNSEVKTRFVPFVSEQLIHAQAGISSDGGITASGFNVTSNTNGYFGLGPADTRLYVATSNAMKMRLANTIYYEFGVSEFSSYATKNTFNNLVHAKAGISMDAAGITFPDGTYQDTAASGSGGGLAGSLSYNGLLEFPTNKTYRLDRYTVEARTFNFLYVDCVTGGCSADFYAAGSTLSNTLNVTPSGASASFATVVPAGSTFSLVVTGITSGNLIQDFGFVAGYTQ